MTAGNARITLASAAPGLFVVLWSTGFIGAKFGLPYAEPMTFLSLRFSVVTAAMLAVSLAAGARWPRSLSEAFHIAVVGMLLQGTYLGGVFLALSKGVSAGLSALIVALQPLLTAVLVRRLLGERVRPLQWLGFVLGFVGVTLVVAEKLRVDAGALWAIVINTAALLGITFGTLYQKRFCGGMDLRSGTVIQNGTAALMALTGAFLLETRTIEWTPSFLFALTWLCLVLSVGATMLLFWLLRRGAAARIASLFYLVAPTTALMAYPLFGETLAAIALLGMGLAVAGVALVMRGGGP
ncbi:MAG: DMT family transporter [Acidobacteriota bacterium]